MNNGDSRQQVGTLPVASFSASVPREKKKEGLPRCHAMRDSTHGVVSRIMDTINAHSAGGKGTKPVVKVKSVKACAFQPISPFRFQLQRKTYIHGSGHVFNFQLGLHVRGQSTGVPSVRRMETGTEAKSDLDQRQSLYCIYKPLKRSERSNWSVFKTLFFILSLSTFLSCVLSLKN